MKYEYSNSYRVGVGGGRFNPRADRPAKETFRQTRWPKPPKPSFVFDPDWARRARALLDQPSLYERRRFGDAFDPRKRDDRKALGWRK